MTNYTLISWERGRTSPAIVHFPAIVQFLGAHPLPEPDSLGERLLRKRREMGWTISHSARALGVDPETWRDGEAGKFILYRRHRVESAKLLGARLADLDQDMRARWNKKHQGTLPAPSAWRTIKGM